jgi:hypothetical protein
MSILFFLTEGQNQCQYHRIKVQDNMKVVVYARMQIVFFSNISMTRTLKGGQPKEHLVFLNK